MIKNNKISIGDVFQFGDAHTGWGYGQVLRSAILQFIIVFEPLFHRPAKFTVVVDSPHLLAGWTMDAKFQTGDWEIIGNTPVNGNYFFPTYQVMINDSCWLTDVDGNPLRQVTPEEGRDLPLKSSVSPIVFEKAFKAHHGMVPWENRFQQLRTKY